MGKFDTIGIDCVAMTVNDLICLGSEPLAILDYIALEREDDDLVAEVCKGLARGAGIASVAIVGGETAIMRDVIRGRKGRGFDLVSMGVGIVEQGRVIDGSRIEDGDVLVGIESSGLHSNGYTLARKIFRGSLQRRIGELDSTLGDALLTPTNIYVRPTLELIKKAEVHGIAHITGGSFSKLVRLVGGRTLAFDIALPEPPALFQLLKKEGGLSDAEMYKTFNMGIGLCLCVPSSVVAKTARIFRSHGFKTHELGSVVKGKGVVVNGLKLV
jgi:phosphoribosylformylglycinamidine cyclo-ligase